MALFRRYPTGDLVSKNSLIMEGTLVDPDELPPGPPPPPPPGEDSDSPGNDDMEGIPEPLQEVR